jgi:hypothetical protein
VFFVYLSIAFGVEETGMNFEFNVNNKMLNYQERRALMRQTFFHRFILLIISTFLISGAVAAQLKALCSYSSKPNPQITSTWLIVSSALGSGDTLWFGFDSTATCGTDIHLGEGGYDFCPPPPPTNVFDVRWRAKCPDSISFCGQLDYRQYYSPTQVDTYTITIQEGDNSCYPIKLKWSKEEIRYICDSARISSNSAFTVWTRIGAYSSFSVRMDMADSITILDPSINKLTLKKYGAKKYNGQILSDPISFRVPLTASNAGIVRTETIYFGKHRDATYCIDDTLYLFDGTIISEWELPAMAPCVCFDARFSDSRTGAGKCMGEGLILDMRPMYTLKDTFRVSLQSGNPGYPMVLSWPSGLDKFFQTAKIGSVDMLTDSMIVTTLEYLSAKIYTTLITDGVTSISDIPAHFSLDQNYPNPFNPTTTIKYQLPTQDYVTLKIFDVLGREVAILVNEVEEPGYKSVNFDAGKLPSGVYFYRIQAGTFVQTNKMLLMK